MATKRRFSRLTPVGGKDKRLHCAKPRRLGFERLEDRTLLSFSVSG